VAGITRTRPCAGPRTVGILPVDGTRHRPRATGRAERCSACL